MNVKHEMNKQLALLLDFKVFRETEDTLHIETKDSLCLWNPCEDYNQIMPLVIGYNIVHEKFPAGYECKVQGTPFKSRIYSLHADLAVSYVEVLIKLLRSQK